MVCLLVELKCAVCCTWHQRALEICLFTSSFLWLSTTTLSRLGYSHFLLINMQAPVRRSVGVILQWVTSQCDYVLLCIAVPPFTDQPSQLKGYSVHTRLSKGPRGFGFNIVGGSRSREFLQVYSVTPGGPPALNTGTRGFSQWLLGEGKFILSCSSFAPIINMKTNYKTNAIEKSVVFSANREPSHQPEPTLSEGPLKVRTWERLYCNINGTIFPRFNKGSVSFCTIML